jgi:hypothetical protein
MLRYHGYYKQRHMQIVVLTAVIIKITVFSDVITCNLPDCYQHFECLLPLIFRPWGQQVLGGTVVMSYLTTRRHIAGDSSLQTKTR